MKRLLILLTLTLLSFSLVSATIYKEDVAHYWSFNQDDFIDEITYFEQSTENFSMNKVGSVTSDGDKTSTLTSSNYFYLNGTLWQESINKTCVVMWFDIPPKNPGYYNYLVRDSSDLSATANLFYVRKFTDTFAGQNEDLSGYVYEVVSVNGGAISAHPSRGRYLFGYHKNNFTRSCVWLNNLGETCSGGAPGKPLPDFNYTVFGKITQWSSTVDNVYVLNRACEGSLMSEIASYGDDPIDSFPHNDALMLSNETNFSIRVRNAVTGEWINNFTISWVDLNDSSNGSDTVFSQKKFTENRNNTINVTFSKSGFASETVTLEASSAFVDHTFDVYKESVNITFKDETKDEKITWRNVSASFIKEGGTTTTYTTSDGTLFLEDAFPPGDYTIRYSADDYDTRDYYLTITSGNKYDLDLYLLNSSKSTLLPITVVTPEGAGIDDLTVSFERFFNNASSYKVVEMSTTSEGGQTNVFFEPFSAWYKIKILHDGSLVKSVTGRRYTTIDSTNGLTISVNLAESLTESFRAALDLVNSYGIEYTRSTRTFSYSYSDTSGLFTNLCMKVYKVVRGNSYEVNSSCSTSQTGTLVASHPNETFDFYAVVEGETSTENSNYKTLAMRYADALQSSTSIFGAFGVFLAIIFISTLALLTGAHPIIPIVFTVLGALASSFIFGVVVGVSTLTVSVIIIVVLSVLMARRKNL